MINHKHKSPTMEARRRMLHQHKSHTEEDKYEIVSRHHDHNLQPKKENRFSMANKYFEGRQMTENLRMKERIQIGSAYQEELVRARQKELYLKNLSQKNSNKKLNFTGIKSKNYLPKPLKQGDHWRKNYPLNLKTCRTHEKMTAKAALLGKITSDRALISEKRDEYQTRKDKKGHPVSLTTHNPLFSFSNNRTGELQNNHKKMSKQRRKSYFLSQTCSLKGSKPTNQDSIKTSENIWIVCDGHGEFGHQVSWYVSNLLHELCREKLCENRMNKQILKEIFSETKASLQQTGMDLSMSGSTCVLVIIHDQKLYCASLGDSVAFVKMHKDNALQIISKHHKPDEPQQKKRIQFFGGRVKRHPDKQTFTNTPIRLWGTGSDSWGPGLAVSRAFGDKMAQKYGLISEPDIIEKKLSGQMKYIVMGTDGLFDQFPPQQIANVVKITKNNCCKMLGEMAKKRWGDYSDDISVIIIYL